MAMVMGNGEVRNDFTCSFSPWNSQTSKRHGSARSLELRLQPSRPPSSLGGGAGSAGVIDAKAALNCWITTSRSSSCSSWRWYRMVFSCIRRRNLSFSCSSSRRRRRANRQSSSSYCNSRALATPSSAWIIGFDRFFAIGVEGLGLGLFFSAGGLGNSHRDPDDDAIGVGGLGLGLFFSAAAPRHSRTRQCRPTIANWRSRFDAMPTNHSQLEPILRRRQWANFHGRACLGLAWCWSLPWVALTWTVVIMPPNNIIVSKAGQKLEPQMRQKSRQNYASEAGQKCVWGSSFWLALLA